MSTVPLTIGDIAPIVLVERHLTPQGNNAYFVLGRSGAFLITKQPHSEGWEVRGEGLASKPSQFHAFCGALAKARIRASR